MPDSANAAARRPEDSGANAVPRTMRAVVCHGPEDYRLETVPVPRPGPGQALVRVEAVGIYGFKRRTPGVMAEYMVFPPEALVHRIDASLPSRFQEGLDLFADGAKSIKVTLIPDNSADQT